MHQPHARTSAASRATKAFAAALLSTAAAVGLTACSDPMPGLTAEEFYERAEENRSRALGPGMRCRAD